MKIGARDSFKFSSPPPRERLTIQQHMKTLFSHNSTHSARRHTQQTTDRFTPCKRKEAPIARHFETKLGNSVSKYMWWVKWQNAHVCIVYYVVNERFRMNIFTSLSIKLASGGPYAGCATPASDISPVLHRPQKQKKDPRTNNARSGLVNISPWPGLLRPSWQAPCSSPESLNDVPRAEELNHEESVR